MILHYIITYINDYIIKIWKITNNDILNLNFEVNLFYQATHKMADDNVRAPVTCRRRLRHLAL